MLSSRGQKTLSSAVTAKRPNAGALPMVFPVAVSALVMVYLKTVNRLQVRIIIIARPSSAVKPAMSISMPVKTLPSAAARWWPVLAIFCLVVKNVIIDSQYNISGYTERQWSKKSGLSISVGANGTLGNAISAASALSEQARKAGEAKSDRAAALYGIAAARSAYDLGQGLSGIMSQPADSRRQG